MIELEKVLVAESEIGALISFSFTMQMTHDSEDGDWLTYKRGTSIYGGTVGLKSGAES